jgi:hypothetical protein
MPCKDLKSWRKEGLMVERRLLIGEEAWRFKFEVDFEEVVPKRLAQ